MQEYQVKAPNGADMTVLYSDARAKELGLLKTSETKAETPQNKAVTPENKAAGSRKKTAPKE